MFLFVIGLLVVIRCRSDTPHRFRHRRVGVGSLTTDRFRRKPYWVIEEIIRLKAFMPRAGVRTIANTFNRLHAARHRTTVSKSYVAEVICKHRYAIEVKRRDIRNKRPAIVAINRIWGLDLCGKQDARGSRRAILGIVDHGSRFAITLKALRIKTSIRLPDTY